MHDTSIGHFADCFGRFCPPAGRALEVGSRDPGENPALRTLLLELGWTCVGVDLREGPNVDMVIKDPFHWPFTDEKFDAVISAQMLEHDRAFWVSILEMARVLRDDGIMIHIAPSRGREHRSPVDCWRFFPDGMAALAEWAGLECLETSIDRSEDCEWGDTVGVFRKRPGGIMRAAIA